jgi:hypothetical protein
VNGDAIRKLDGIRIIDETNDVAMLVEAGADTMERHRDQLAGWTVSEETGYSLPAPGAPQSRDDTR